MTSIPYCTRTWNITAGCTKVSEGCRNCWACGLAAGRLSHLPDYAGLTLNGNWTGEVRLLEHKLEQPLRWRKPQTIFVNSMSDLFHDKVPDLFLYKVFGRIQKSPQHKYLILTKRVERAMWFFRNCPIIKTFDNLWLGVSVEDQQIADERIPLLLQTPAAHRWISVEPMLDDISLIYAADICLPGGDVPAVHIGDFINWVVVGCESGPNRRLCKLEWVESIVAQCRANYIPVYVKQININGRCERNIENFPQHLRIRELPV